MLVSDIDRDVTGATMNDNPEPEGFYRLVEVLRLVPISKTAWYDGVRGGRYCPGVSLAPRTTAYRVSDIRELCALLAEGKDWRDREVMA